MLKYLSDYVCAMKVGSGDITWHEIIVKMCQYDLPIFLASGASNFNEVKMAVKLIKKN